jgi:hypothetical protein
MTRAHDRSRPKEGVRSRLASLAIAQHGRRDSADPRQSKLCRRHSVGLDRPEQCTRPAADARLRASACSVVTAESRAPTVRKNYLARRSGRFLARRGRCSKTPQYVVDRFLRCRPMPGHERVARRRPGIANDINRQCTAACLTSHGSGHISAPPRWGAGSRRKPRRSLTTRTATSQAILAAEFYSRGRCALAAMPVHSLCADARQGWTRDGE